MKCSCIAMLGFPTLHLHSIRVISFLDGRYEAVDYVSNRSADIVCYRYWYLAEMQIGELIV